MSREQAETHVRILTEIMETHFATKQDIKDLETHAIRDLAVRMDSKFAEADLRFQDVLNRIQQSEYRMTIKLGTIVSVAVGVAVTLAKLV